MTVFHQHPARVTLVGCDASTVFFADLNDDAFAVAERLAELSATASAYGCEPTMRVERVDTATAADQEAHDMSLHTEPHPCAGRSVVLPCHPDRPADPAPTVFHVQDWWDRISGTSWRASTTSAACVRYAVRSAVADLPADDAVVYGEVGALGYLVHQSELPA